MSDADIYWLYAGKKELVGLGVKEDTIFEGISPQEQDISLTQAELTQEQCKKLIPEGSYCYKSVNGLFVHCPFHDVIPSFPKQSNGYCHYLKRGDFQTGSLGLLWDSCKECGINEYTHDYD